MKTCQCVWLSMCSNLLLCRLCSSHVYIKKGESKSESWELWVRARKGENVPFGSMTLRTTSSIVVWFVVLSATAALGCYYEGDVFVNGYRANEFWTMPSSVRWNKVFLLVLFPRFFHSFLRLRWGEYMAHYIVMALRRHVKMFILYILCYSDRRFWCF